MNRPNQTSEPIPEVPVAPLGASLSGLDRSGHLTVLGLDRYRLGEANAAAREAAERHLATCALCAGIYAELQAEDAVLPIPLPPAAVRRAAQAPKIARRIGPSAVVVSLLAMAAVALLVARSLSDGSDAPVLSFDPAAAPDRVQARGGPLELAVYIHDGTTSRAVDSGAVIRRGDRARFQVLLSHGAFLMVGGMDDRGDVYAGYPQEDEASAVYVPKTDGFLQLPTAIEFDEIPGDEHLFAMVCDHPFGFAEFAPVMRSLAGLVTSREAPVGCSIERVDLKKQPTF